VKLEIHFLASTPNSVNDALIPIAKKNFQDLGINFIADQMEFKSVADKVRKHDYQMSFMGAGQTVDPTSDLAQTFKTGAIANDFQYSNTKVDSDIAQAYKETDQTKRKAILANAYKILNDDLPSLPLYQREDVWGINARISGVEPAPYRDLFMDLYKATIK
jgi:peptide/nickel transport system substrate-binding protein